MLKNASNYAIKTEAYPLWYVEDFEEPRTTHGKRRVSARLGWVGEKGSFFGILLHVFV